MSTATKEKKGTPNFLLNLLLLLAKKCRQDETESEFSERIRKAINRAFLRIKQQVLDSMFADTVPGHEANCFMLEGYVDDVLRSGDGQQDQAFLRELHARRIDILTQMTPR
jgi:hypothetical protein